MLKDEEINKLRSQNEALSLEVIEVNKELQHTQAYAQSLVNEIESITPLKKHLKKQIKLRLKKIDYKISVMLTKNNLYNPESIEISADSHLIHRHDIKNFELYNEPETVSILYRFYGLLKRWLIKLIKTVRG